MAPYLEGHEIAFNASDRKSWKKYARSMDEYLRCELLVIVVGGMRLLSLLKKKQGCDELILIFTTFVPFFNLILAGHAGKGSLFVGRVQPFNVFFFSRPAFVKLP